MYMLVQTVLQVMILAHTKDIGQLINPDFDPDESCKFDVYQL